ncbi:MAG: AAA family ATPase [Fibromonadaceae bacterium]|nr:AAA family ATPase [Fibromonadaceae bacterium]
MKINKVELKNYRIHKEYEQTFENGINLLLGNNGSGKSSVLEAMGFALFNSNVRSANEDIVSKGEKSGSAKVFFIGSDGKEYEIERKFGTGAGVKLTSVDSLQKWAGNTEVYKQVSKILEIDSINGVFFESVICAKQNQFIDIFTKTDEPRAKHFNELFDTVIYNDLWKKLGEQNEKKYEEDKIRKEERRKTLVAGQKNIEELKKSLQAGKEKLQAENKNLEILKKDLGIKEQVLAAKKDLEKSEYNIKRFIYARDNDKQTFKDSEQAKLFLEKYKNECAKYESAKKQSDVLERNFQAFRYAVKNFDDLQKQLGFCPILKEPCPRIAEKGKSNSLPPELKAKITKAEQDKKQAEELQSEINKLRIETLNPLQEIYNKCLQNKKTASEYEMRKKRLEESEKNILEEMEHKKKLENKLNELKTSVSEEEVLKLRAKYEENVRVVASLQKDIEQKNKEIEEHADTEKKISELNSELGIIQQKLELTKIFRTQIKDLGRIVAEERVQRIALIATDYLNKITNRPESILWVCNESEKYSLYLDNGQNKCSFVNLSGGEQISVAIAIRLALSQEFGNTGLIILDEPTNNLDQSKRQLLAENLPKMVENLTQLFVVTHDDTFRNSATKVIEFGEEK